MSSDVLLQVDIGHQKSCGCQLILLLFEEDCRGLLEIVDEAGQYVQSHKFP